MKILIVSATFSEIGPLYGETQLILKHDNFFSRHLFNNHEIDFLITGVGMVSTAYRMGRITCTIKYDLALNLGIAGSFNKDISIGDVVDVDQDMISELGAENENEFMKIYELKVGQINAENTLWQVKNNYKISNRVIQKLRMVKGITVNTVHGNKESIEKVVQMFHPDIETMEGAAFLQVCDEENIKCAQIRAISNYVEPRNQANWNIKLAIKKLNEKALEILRTL